MSQRPQRLPADALTRLTADLRTRSSAPPELAASARSLPLVRDLWSSRLIALVTLVQRFEAAASPEAFAVWSYRGLSASLARLDVARLDVLALLIALAPFDCRDLPTNDPDGDTPRQPLRTSTAAAALGSDLVDALDAIIDGVLAAIEAGEVPPPITTRLSAMVPTVPTIAVEDRGTAVALAFGMSAVPVDVDGSFSASRVFEAHKYENAKLLAYLLTHMKSLGLEPTDDILSMILTTGWVAQAPDPVFAWQTLRSAMLRLEAAEGTSQATAAGTDRVVVRPAVLDEVLAHLATREESLRQSRRIVESTTRRLRTTAHDEERAHALADIYRSLVEGPVRQYGWAMRCLAAGAWTPPPMLGTLAAGFAADPWLNAAVLPKLLPGIRNGQAHEALEWDGRRGVYVVEDTAVDYGRVDIATADCMSFALGCEAAFAHWRALTAAPDGRFPSVGQPGRMAEWRRVEALFGTNGLRINTFEFNALRVEARVERLDQQDINPSLQALVHARQLLPHAESFAYFISEADEPAIEVTAAALDATHPVWLHARDLFNTMPLSTFLPANLSARMRCEPERIATQAAAWIALDCTLDAIDGLPPIWRAEDLWLAIARVKHARLALRQSIPITAHPDRLESAAEVLGSVQAELGTLLPFARADQFDLRLPIMRLRALWTDWGPVARMPGVSNVRHDKSPGYHLRPQRRTSSPHGHWTNI